MTSNLVILAYSGGLDTSYCIKYLTEERQFNVHAVMVDTGGFSPEEIEEARQNALDLGAGKFICLNKTEEYYSDCIRYLVYGNVLRNNSYPLSVSAERVFQAQAIAEYAVSEKATAIAHGSTGAGNDQVRFDITFRVNAPNMEIITPIRDLQLSRQEEIDYLTSHGISKDWSKAEYSVNQGLWGTTVGGKETLTSHQGLPEEHYPTQINETKSREVSLEFIKGELMGIDGEKYQSPVKAIQDLERISAPFGIGRDIHVGDTVIGIKGRVAFQASAPVLIIKAHHLLEKHTLSKWQLQLKEQLSGWYGMLLHEGQAMEPAMRDIEAFLLASQKTVTGKVYVTLKPYHFELQGIESDFDLMSAKFGAYGEMNKAWDGEDVKGFSKILANSSMIHKSINND